MASDDPSSAEDRLIARYFKPLARDPAALGLTDDAAVYAPPAGHDLVLTKDALVAGVHFFADDPADTIAQKALRVNLSDLAAKGAMPAGFLLALALPSSIDESGDETWLAAFAAGLDADCKTYGIALFGGDTVRTPGPLTISVSAFGTVPAGTMVKRSGAQQGDRVFVSGTIGDAALGLRLRGAQCPKHLQLRYLQPQPRTALTEAVRAHATASMDVSDGLVGDLAKLCRASGVSAVVEAGAVPLSDAARRAVAADTALFEAALTGGDDYEILCTVPPSRAEAFAADAQKAGVAVTTIGTIVEGRATPRFVKTDGTVLSFQRMSFSHF
jgi:thiamine-monophosphate kinase